MNFKRIKSWSTEFGNWVYEAEPAILFVLVIILAFLLGFYTWSSEASIRYSGLGLQLAGMFLAIYGLLRIRIHFGQSSLWYLFKRWIQKLPKWKRDPITCDLSVREEGDRLISQAESSWEDDPDKPVEERINTLVKNIGLIRQAQALHAGLINELKESHEGQKKEAEKRTSEVEAKLQKDLESSHTSDLFISFVGLLWLTVGIILSTLSSEIYQIIN